MRTLSALAAAAFILPLPAFAADLARGKELFEQRCAVCHGPEGKGDGPTAAALPPETKPRNLQEGNFKFVKDDASLKKVIHEGGAAVGLSPLMAGAPDLNDADLESVVAFVRGLKK